MRAVRFGSRFSFAHLGAATGLLATPTFKVQCYEENDKKPVGLNPFHNVLPALQNSYKSKNPGQVVSKHGDNTSKVVRVVLTGGPCGGKSSCLEHIRQEATNAGFDVIMCPEVATVIFNSGYKLPPSDDPNFAESCFGFQLTVAKLQLQLERNLIYLASLSGTPTIIIFDRGLVDGKAYLTDEAGNINEEQWRSLVSELTDSKLQPVDEQYCIDRYDVVVHLVTTAEEGLVGADGAPLYRHGWLTDDSGHRVYRRETPAQARELDQRTRQVWEKHPGLVVVKNSEGGMNDKIRAAVEAIMTKAEEVHPQQVNQQTMRRRMRELSLQNAQLQRRLAKLENLQQR
eukprot:TRINITY_DN107012_c0_g1_i1.p1 TRINITY_DN107012_c0_g1~~TRINITY_DN107012_c0_g1_i1.p1  ORF type:complete len:360 (-),score=62.08 TRINITY_DN107012_c0_g1_i1:164-1192(-)